MSGTCARRLNLYSWRHIRDARRRYRASASTLPFNSSTITSAACRYAPRSNSIHGKKSSQVFHPTNHAYLSYNQSPPQYGGSVPVRRPAALLHRRPGHLLLLRPFPLTRFTADPFNAGVNRCQPPL